MPAQWPPKKGNNFGKKKSTLTETVDLIPKKLSRFKSQISACVDFFCPKFFPFMGGYHGCTGAQNRFWTSFTPAEQHGSKNHPHIGPLFSAGVRDIPNRSFVPMPHHVCARKGKKAGPKKSTHAEIFMGPTF
jgi:hypothetical protein